MRWWAAFWLWFLLLGVGAAQDLTVVIDPGHGDRAWGGVPADPGADYAGYQECVYTWDTAMRLRRRLLAAGAEVVLTLEDPDDDYQPRNRCDGFIFKRLVDFPYPRTQHQALISRVATANRVYRSANHRVYFLSLHFDSTSPRVAGVSFYYPSWGTRRPFVDRLETELRRTRRQRIDLGTGLEVGLSSPGHYAVLNQSENPDSYLIEFGNLRSRAPDGSNPDLWRMRSARVREDYARIVSGVVLEDARRSAPPARPDFPLALLFLGGSLVAVVSYKSSLRAVCQPYPER